MPAQGSLKVKIIHHLTLTLFAELAKHIMNNVINMVHDFHLVIIRNYLAYSFVTLYNNIHKKCILLVSLINPKIHHWFRNT